MKSIGVLVVRNICKELFFCSVPAAYFSCLFPPQVSVFNRISVYLLCCFSLAFLIFFPGFCSYSKPPAIEYPSPQIITRVQNSCMLNYISLRLSFWKQERRKKKKKALVSLSWNSIWKIKHVLPMAVVHPQNCVHSQAAVWCEHHSHSPLHILSFHCS